MRRRSDLSRASMILAAFLLAAATAPALRGDELPMVLDVEFQPLSAQAKRMAEALVMLGEPLGRDDSEKLEKAVDSTGGEAAIRAIQEVLDRRCLIGVDDQPREPGQGGAGAGGAPADAARLAVFLVKVQNEAGVTAELRAQSPNAAPLYRRSTGQSRAEADDPPCRRSPSAGWTWRCSATGPMKPTLSGLDVEYRLLQIYSRDAGQREAKISFNVGQGTQDLGFRSDVDILFNCEPAVPVVARRPRRGRPARHGVVPDPRRHGTGLSVAQAAGSRPTSSSTPRSTARPARTCSLPPGTYTVEYTRGPEYLSPEEDDHRPAPRRATASRSRSSGGSHLAKQNWFSGDHHVHAAGCGHYESPTEGVRPEDMMRHILGEDLDVGCVLSWGPCWYAQKQFFDGKLHPLSTPEYLMRYDVEVSGFPSSHAGHLCLLRLKEDDYPGTTRIEEWPSWDLPVLKWGKSQGGVVGFSHSGWGLKMRRRSAAVVCDPPLRRHRRQRVHRRRRPRRGRLHLDASTRRPPGS